MSKYHQTFQPGSIRGHNVGVNDATFDQRVCITDPSAGTRGRPSSAPAADAVVVTAIASEYAAVAAHLSEPFEERTEDGTLYRIGELKGSLRSRRVALVQVGPGQVDAGVSLERARTAFSPEVVLFVGVAGGVKDVRLGDVVVADAVYDYETGKEDAEGFRSRAKTAAPSHAAVQRAMDVVFRQEWTKRILTPPVTEPPRAFVKPVAAGNKVVADKEALTAERLRQYCGDAVAVEMEGYGFLRSAYLTSGAHSLVVRGISDLLSGKTEASDDRWQPVAAAHAAAFACEFLDLFAPEG
ncbi:MULTISPECIES: 5'-methylthioadenosine/S-adenosylhomocysteine nucleosidase [unclassified Nocardiopsis]|uniref:5'-methylthioadenosine/S-adenosylhomocysteine nucleosidase family protein n=1 Tax=unclassified Nocardiopsis TaxID=2649073 RepID=UPI001F3C0FB3|nr:MULTISPECIES: 5'-methylthioadenosine/S-adenosylhomocysteine nucleosidase [unclassified Nocardiopsis]